jgi:hypothetical protein
MPRKLTMIENGGLVEVYVHTVVVARYHEKRIYLHGTNGIESYMYCSMEAAEDWFDKNGILHFRFDRNKIACSPHVVGFNPDDSLICSPVFYDLLPEEKKKAFRLYSFTETGKKNFRKMAVNKNPAAGNGMPPAGIIGLP